MLFRSCRPSQSSRLVAGRRGAFKSVAGGAVMKARSKKDWVGFWAWPFLLEPCHLIASFPDPVKHRVSAQCNYMLKIVGLG